MKYIATSVLDSRPAKRRFLGCMDTVFRKANKMQRYCGERSKVAVIVELGEKYFVYRSFEVENWPPPMTEIVSLVD